MLFSIRMVSFQSTMIITAIIAAGLSLAANSPQSRDEQTSVRNNEKQFKIKGEFSWHKQAFMAL
ncbi:MAG: hypothetical protein GY805_32965 [Chloroflexi bacterium]|nr:hypothetical protein [Chloroflexota bacterium]